MAELSPSPPMTVPDRPWSRTAAEVIATLRADPQQGLTDAEAAARLRRFGPNVLRQVPPRHILSIVADQFRSAVVLLLAAAAVVALLFAEFLESLAIGVVLLVNTLLGFLTEWRAQRSMEALRRLGRAETVVRRSGTWRTIAAEGVVPGDLVLLEGGDVISADIRLIEASKLQVDESALTGESLPVGKSIAPLPEATLLMERRNMLFKGTSVTRGTALGIVVATGLETELGAISRLVAEAVPEDTPLQQRLDALGGRLVRIMLVFAVLLAAAAILAGHETLLAIQVAIALAVAAIPEGLPIVATIALARGMWRLARRNALIVRLSAVETLGATGVILTDKTGTLTENRMTVSVIELADTTVQVGGTGLELEGDFHTRHGAPDAAMAALLERLLRSAALCSNASVTRSASGEVTTVGDPTEVALLVAAAKFGIDRAALGATYPELREEAFTPETKAMATFNRDADGIGVHVKGAVESILPCCTAIWTAAGLRPLDEARRAALARSAHELGAAGLRTLAIACRRVDTDAAEPYAELEFLGITGLLDPPRQGVREAIARCREAGVRVIMVTGDHAATAGYIAQNLGLLDPATLETGPGLATVPRSAAGVQVIDARTDFPIGDAPATPPLLAAPVIARTTPQQKLDLIRRFQQAGHVVAMTGDGVNDAPALKQADIGIAMGIRGTAVAREAAAMVLQDDDFSTIVEAITLGRTIYANIRKFVLYLFSCNISEILIVALATVAGAPLPLLPLQILFLNLVTDVFPALALGVGGQVPGLMGRPPRRADEPLIAARHWWLILVYGALMSATVLGAMAAAIHGLGFEGDRAVTVSFLTLALAQIWHVFNMRGREEDWVRSEISRNPWIWGAIALCLTLVLAAVYVPGISGALQLADPGVSGWLLVVGASFVPLLLGPLARALARRLP